jgi:hypothetical protein
MNSETINLIPKEKYVMKLCKVLEEPVTEEEKNIYNLIKNHIETNVFMWDIININNFKFTLPKTSFNQEVKINFKEWEEQEVSYDESYTSRDLTPEQLNEIWETGKFSVKSKVNDLPYVWQLSEWLFKGKQEKINSFYVDLSAAYALLCYISNKFSIYRNKEDFNFFSPFRYFYIALQDYYHLFFGRPRYSNEYVNRIRYPQDYTKEVLSEYHSELINSNPCINTKIIYPKARKLILKVWEGFQKRWNEEKIVVEDDLRRQNLNPEELEEKLNEIRFNKLVEAYEKTEKFDESRKKAIVEMLKGKRIFNFIMYDYNNKIEKTKKEIEEKIFKEFPIRSKFNDWEEEKIKQELKLVSFKFEEERDRRISEELSQYPSVKILVEANIKFFKNYDEFFKKWQEKQPKNPKYVYSITKLYIPPYPVNQTRQNTFYIYKEDYEYDVKTDHHLWKINLLFKRLISSYNNLLVFGYWTFFNSSFGIKALFGCDIQEDYNCDYSTGVVTVSSYGFNYPSSIKYIFEWINKSRDEFEKSSEKGFLSGKTGKVLNLIENYFFKLICWGSIVVFLYPVAILMYSILCFLLMLLGYVLVTIFIPIAQLIFIFIINWDDIQCDCCDFFPFFWILLKRVIIQGILHLLLTFVIIIVQILTAIIVFIFACLRWTIRSIYDCFTYSIIRCNATIPKTDTSFAWRISGPGYSRKLYIKIELEEALLLVRAVLEKSELKNFEETMLKMIDQPLTNFENIRNRIFVPLNGYISEHPKLAKSVNEYKNILHSQINERSNIYPILNLNIRFSKSELELLLEASYQLVKDCVEKNNLDFIWKANGLVPGNWELLTEKLLISAFNEEILTNIDDSEVRIENKKPKHLAIQKLEEDLDLFSYKNIAEERVKNNRHSLKKSAFFFPGVGSMMQPKLDKFGYNHDFNLEGVNNNMNYRRRICQRQRDDRNSNMINNSDLNNLFIDEFMNLQVNCLKDEKRTAEEQEEDNKLDESYLQENTQRNLIEED